MSDPFPPLRAPYGGTSPDLKGDLVFAGSNAVVLGRATLGAGAWLGAGSVIRADGHYVQIGTDFHLGDHATVHIAHEVYPTHIGDRVTVGHGAVVHACTVADGCVVEAGAVILDGTQIGAGSVITAGSVVFPRSTLEGGWIYSGSPAKPIAEIAPADLEACHQKTRAAPSLAAPSTSTPGATPDCFVAPSAQVFGTITAQEGASVWYGCRLDAGQHRIEIGAGTNIQDNSTITCATSDVVLGSDVTIGHNVTLTDCTVDQGSLVGIGAIIAPGTVVETDVLVAAGAQTEPGQRLTKGHVWAGRPARPIAEMDDRKRKIMSTTLPHYRAYAEAFGKTPHVPLT